MYEVSTRKPTNDTVTESGRPQLANHNVIRGSIQKFPDWPPGARSANGTALCHLVQLYRYSVNQSSEFCSHNPLCCFSSVRCLFSLSTQSGNFWMHPSMILVAIQSLMATWILRPHSWSARKKVAMQLTTPICWLSHVLSIM